MAYRYAANIEGEVMDYCDVNISQLSDATIVNLCIHQKMEGLTIEQVGEALEQVINTGQCRKLIIDFKNVEFITSHLLRILTSLHRHMEEIGGKMILCHINEQLMQVFAITRLDQLLNFADTQDEALATLRSVS
ncbi:MAG: STAS domain-containing protein [Phycisphaerae bacterium]|nr:STAS domain-containing protein [Phycisphaerae bacterium]